MTESKAWARCENIDHVQLLKHQGARFWHVSEYDDQRKTWDLKAIVPADPPVKMYIRKLFNHDDSSYRVCLGSDDIGPLCPNASWASQSLSVLWQLYTEQQAVLPVRQQVRDNNKTRVDEADEKEKKGQEDRLVAISNPPTPRQLHKRGKMARYGLPLTVRDWLRKEDAAFIKGRQGFSRELMPWLDEHQIRYSAMTWPTAGVDIFIDNATQIVVRLFCSYIEKPALYASSVAFLQCMGPTAPFDVQLWYRSLALKEYLTNLIRKTNGRASTSFG